jgi:hypothetical protein
VIRSSVGSSAGSETCRRAGVGAGRPARVRTGRSASVVAGFVAAAGVRDMNKGDTAAKATDGVARGLMEADATARATRSATVVGGVEDEVAPGVGSRTATTSAGVTAGVVAGVAVGSTIVIRTGPAVRPVKNQTRASRGPVRLKIIPAIEPEKTAGTGRFYAEPANQPVLCEPSGSCFLASGTPYTSHAGPTKGPAQVSLTSASAALCCSHLARKGSQRRASAASRLPSRQRPSFLLWRPCTLAYSSAAAAAASDASCFDPCELQPCFAALLVRRAVED